MAIKVRSTSEYASHGIKVLIYGKAGVGKTTLCATAPNPLILSAESGLLSITDKDIPFIDIASLDDLAEAYAFVTTGEGQKYSTICLDSISEIGEKVLADEKRNAKDKRQAYGELKDKVENLLRLFRDIPDKDIVFVAKQEKLQDETGAMHYAPFMPGQKLSQSMSYFFDEVLCLRIGEDDEGFFRYIQTQPDNLYEGKDRSRKLNPNGEKPDLTWIFNKIKGIAPENNNDKEN